MEDKKVGWRERFTIWFVSRFLHLSPECFPGLYRWLFTPDHLTLVRPVVTIILLRRCLLGSLSPQDFIVGIIICVFSDLFDGPLARVLRNRYKIEPMSFLLARWIPLFQGGHFDTLSDKFALGTGIYIAIYFGYPWLPLLGMFSFAIVKTVSSFHGAWLMGFRYRDLGLALIGLAPKNFGSKLKEFGVRANQSLLEGQIATVCQSFVLGLAALWTVTGWIYFVTFAYAVALAVIICDFIAYRKYLERYLTENKGELLSRPEHFLTHVRISLPFEQGNNGNVSLLMSRLILLIGGYYLVKPQNISPQT